MGRKPIKRSPKEQSFIKVLYQDVSEFSQHMRIPPAFIKNFNGKSLSKCALRGPSGTWDVKLERRQNGLFFHDDGWQGFVKDHVLEKGDFLVFNYDGKSNFNVTIYDRTCCEKDEEAARRRDTDTPVHSANKGNEDRVKVEIVDSETESTTEESETESTTEDSETESTTEDSETESTRDDSDTETETESTRDESKTETSI